MKYLKNEFYGLPDAKAGEKWRNVCRRYWKEFHRIKHKFPKAFVEEMLEGHGLHDSNIRLLSAECEKQHYNLRLLLEDGFDLNVFHSIILSEISSFRCETEFGVEWLYCEILPQKKRRFSMEVFFSDGNTLYVEFEKLEYSREVSDPGRNEN